MTTELNF